MNGDTIDKMDFPYLAKVTAINVAAIARLAAAPAAPADVALQGAVGSDIKLVAPGNVEAREVMVRGHDGVEVRT